jgi:hypothetical protein
MAVDRSKWPIMVRIGLWGLPDRLSAWIFCWLSVALALGSGIAALLVHPFFVLGILALLSGLWYYLSISWVDEHSRWK